MLQAIKAKPANCKVGTQRVTKFYKPDMEWQCQPVLIAPQKGI
jgi:hypothetical protein